MKFAGAAVLISATTAIGFLLSDNAKKKMLICRELISLCDLLSVDIAFRSSPVTELVDTLLQGAGFTQLGFISSDYIRDKLDVLSPLSSDENREVSSFLYSLGKSDSKSQLMLIDGFKEYIKTAENRYADKHAKEAKLFVSFGFFGGAVISLLII